MNDINEIEQLFNTLKTNNFIEFKKILNSNPNIDINIRDDKNNYLLTHAVHSGNHEIIKLLAERGARMDIVDKDYRSILNIPIDRNLLDLLELLLKLNKNSIGISMVDIRDKNDNIPLHYAIKDKNIEGVVLLLKYGSNINIIDKDGCNSLHLAIYARSFDICKLILQNTININARCITGETGLHIACNLQLINIIKLLISYNINVEQKDYEHEYTALHYAINLNNIEIVKNLLAAGAEPDTQDLYGNTAIHFCLLENNIQMLEIIMKTKKINYNIWNIEGKIPLHILLMSEKGGNDCHNKANYIDILMKESNVNIQDGINGNSCLHYLCKLDLWKKYIHILKYKKLDIFLCNKENIRPVDYINDNDKNIFIDMITFSYINRLRTVKSEWQSDWDNICTKELYDINKINNSNNSNNSNSNDNKSNCLSKINNNDEINIKEIKFNDSEDKCINIIKYKLLKMINDVSENKRCSIPSFPIKKNSICIKVTEGNHLQFCTFTGSTMDILFGLVYLLNKHKNACSTLSKNFIENKELCKFYQSIGIIMNTRCEFLNFEIVWVQYKLHLVDNFTNQFNKCINSSNKRFIILPIGIELREGSHANYLLYDKEINEIERFEPHGATIPIGLNYNGDLLDNLLETKFKNILPNVKYIKPNDYLPKIGFQLMDVFESKKKKIGDPGGFCALWSIWYIDMRITYSELSRNKLVDKLIQTLRKNNISFKNMIRNYSSNILDIRDKVFDKANIDINHWLNDAYTPKQFDIIIKEIETKINNII